jgi:hypothetical protein
VAGRRQRERLLRFAADFTPRMWAIESASGLGALLAQQLVAVGETELGLCATVPQGHPEAATPHGSIQQLDTYAIPEAQDPAYAAGFGDPSIHEVALDPEKPFAYFSYDAGGFRVATYNHDRLEEVGAFIDEGGNNFWAVEIWHDENGEKFVLASDRDFGLCIFQYPGPTS